MFSKLLKHEWKANSGLLGILSLCSLGIGVLGIFVMRGIIYMSELAEKEDAAYLGVTGLSTILPFMFLTLFAYFLAVQFINVFRFYKSRFTDEGYLTFTLPVNAHQIFLSSFLNILFWLLISAVVVVVAVILIVVVGAWEPLTEFFREMQEYGGTFEDIYMEEINEPGYQTFNVLTIISAVLSVPYSIILIMTSITLGCGLAKKHKILASIGMYYGINVAVGMVESILTVVPTIAMASDFYDRYYIYTNWTIGITMALQVGLMLGGYFLSTHLMKHKLNLP